MFAASLPFWGNRPSARERKSGLGGDRVNGRSAGASSHHGIRRDEPLCHQLHQFIRRYHAHVGVHGNVPSQEQDIACVEIHAGSACCAHEDTAALTYCKEWTRSVFILEEDRHGPAQEGHVLHEVGRRACHGKCHPQCVTQATLLGSDASSGLHQSHWIGQPLQPERRTWSPVHANPQAEELLISVMENWQCKYTPGSRTDSRELQRGPGVPFC